MSATGAECRRRASPGRTAGLRERSGCPGARLRRRLRRGVARRDRATIGTEMVGEDFQDVADVVVLWWREDDGDLVDALVDAIPAHCLRGSGVAAHTEGGS